MPDYRNGLRQLSVLNIKRSLSKSSSINSLRSMLVPSFDKGQQPKRKKIQGSGLSFKRKKLSSLFRLSRNLAKEVEPIEPQCQDSANDTEPLQKDPETPKIPEFHQSLEKSADSIKIDLKSPQKTPQNKSSHRHNIQKRHYTGLQPPIPSENQNWRNLLALDLKKLSSKNPVFSTIEEEEPVMLPLTTTFNFSKPRGLLVTLKGFYNLSRLADDDEDTLVGLHKTTPVSAMTAELMTPEPERAEKPEKSEFLDYFNAAIAPLGSNHLYKGVGSVAQLSKRLEMTRLDEYPSQDTTLYEDSPKKRKTPEIFAIPEIVATILWFVEARIIAPAEKMAPSKQPLSFEKVQHDYETDQVMKEVWQARSNQEWNQLILASYFKAEDANLRILGKNQYYSSQQSSNLFHVKEATKTLYNCLFVNRLFYRIAKKLLFNTMLFNSDTSFNRLISQLKNDDSGEFQDQVRSSATETLLLHKVKHVSQDQVNLLASYLTANGNRLEWIEMYICPSIYPPLLLFTSYMNSSPSRLKKLVLAGSNSKKINNFFLRIVATNCPALEKIDLRLCEHFSDAGLCEMAKNCVKLKYVNVGRFKKCENITDSSICALIRGCESLETLGCAGCHVTDQVLYDLASFQNTTLEKLSLNNCTRLTNEGFNSVFGSAQFGKLLVLEIRNVVSLQDFTEIIKFKDLKARNGQGFFVEKCELLESRMKEQEIAFSLEKSRRLLKDLQQWVEQPDSDVLIDQFVLRKKQEMDPCLSEIAEEDNSSSISAYPEIALEKKDSHDI